MAQEISNSDDVIDSREVIERIEELETERSDLSDAWDEARTARDETAEEDTEAHAAATKVVIDARTALQDWDSDYGDELKALQALQDEAEGYAPDWKHGATLVRDSYFTEYAEELCKDIGDMPKEIPSYIVIDWEATAENIKQDYTSVEFDSVTYWIR